MVNGLSKLKEYFYQALKPQKLVDNDLNKITCIRYTMTWRCNFKCVSCHIWQMKVNKEEELTPDDIDKFTQNKLLKDVKEIILSGGEPILRDDFPEIILALHKNLKKAKFSITINGYFPKRTYEFFKRIRKEAPDLKWALIGVSLNGPKEIHDQSRGIPGSYERVLETAQLLKEFSDHVDFSFTFLKNNVDYYSWVKDLAKSMGLGVHVCWTVMNDRFRTTQEDLVFQNNPKLIPVLEEFSELDKIKFTKNYKKDFFKYKPAIKRAYLYDSIINKRIMPCHAARTFFHLDPYGNIYPCNFKLTEDRKLGNIKQQPFEEIWKNIPQRIFDEIQTGKCMYPNGLCGDSDIFRSIQQVDTPIFQWYMEKRKNNEKLIDKKNE